MNSDAPTRLRQPIRLGHRYPVRLKPFTTVRELISFSQREAEKIDDFSGQWQRVSAELVMALQTGLVADLDVAVARFKMTAAGRRWLGS
jgi:hypothetical protein